MTKAIAKNHYTDDAGARRISRTPLHSQTSRSNQTNRWADWLGYTVPATYTSAVEEYEALIRTAGLSDLSPMGKYMVSGPGAARYINHLVVADVSAALPATCLITPFCQSSGKVINIAAVSSLSEDRWWMVTDGRHLPWLRQAARGFDVEIEDRSSAYAGLGLRGPAAGEILKAAGLDILNNLAPGQTGHYAMTEVDLIVSHDPGLGGPGFSLWCSADQGVIFWNKILSAGKSFGLACAGVDASELVRVRSGFPSARKDFMPAPEAIRSDRRRSAIELGFGQQLNFDKGAFNGRSALLEEARTGASLVLARLSFSAGTPPPGTRILDEKGKRPVGIVTSSASAPHLVEARGLGFILADFAVAGTKVSVKTIGNVELLQKETVDACKVLSLPGFSI